MKSTAGRQVLKRIYMEHIPPRDQCDDPTCSACTRRLNPAVTLQRDHKLLVICPNCGWEMLE
jgi:RNase P subunit RPR2